MITLMKTDLTLCCVAPVSHHKTEIKVALLLVQYSVNEKSAVCRVLMMEVDMWESGTETEDSPPSA